MATLALEAFELANLASPSAGAELEVFPLRGASPEARLGVPGTLCAPECFADASFGAAPGPGELYECFCFLLVMRAVDS